MSSPAQLPDNLTIGAASKTWRAAGRLWEGCQIWLLTSRFGQFVNSWCAPILLTMLAGLMRFIHLGNPHKLVFDETYYVKEGYSLYVSGYERNWPPHEEGEPNQANLDFEAGQPHMLETAEYVVHPPVGKWMIGLGIRLFGVGSSFGWRFSSAVVGTLSIFIIIVAARRLFESQVLGCVAGLLLMVDGQHIVHSRTGLLDPFLMFWALLAFYLILVDRRQYQRRLQKRIEYDDAEPSSGLIRTQIRRLGPGTGMRWFLLLAGICLGLATGVKWSGIYFAAIFGVLVVAWDMADRKAAGVQSWVLGGLTRDGIKDFCLMIPVLVVTYLATWSGWFLTKGGYFRDWYQLKGEYGLLGALKSLGHYHIEAWKFHTGLTASHSYQENALSWLIQRRPTSFYWGPTDKGCDGNTCEAITSLGNPAIWWFGVIALLVVLYFAVIWADRRAWAIVAGYIGGYVPWFLYLNRTVFTFYTVAFVPFVALALTYFIGVLIGPKQASLVRRRRGTIAAGAIVVSALILAAYFWPIWTGESITYNYWHTHMWLPSWI